MRRLILLAITFACGDQTAHAAWRWCSGKLRVAPHEEGFEEVTCAARRPVVTQESLKDIGPKIRWLIGEYEIPPQPDGAAWISLAVRDYLLGNVSSGSDLSEWMNGQGDSLLLAAILDRTRKPNEKVGDLTLWQHSLCLCEGPSACSCAPRIRKMLAYGADVNVVVGSNFSPLSYVLAVGCTKAFTQLLASGADVNVRAGTFGATPLHVATLQGLGLVRLLLRHGAQVNAVNYNNQTPLNYAYDCQAEGEPGEREAIINFLQARGGKLGAELSGGPMEPASE